MAKRTLKIKQKD